MILLVAVTIFPFRLSISENLKCRYNKRTLDAGLFQVRGYKLIQIKEKHVAETEMGKDSLSLQQIEIEIP